MATPNKQDALARASRIQTPYEYKPQEQRDAEAKAAEAQKKPQAYPIYKRRDEAQGRIDFSEKLYQESLSVEDGGDGEAGFAATTLFAPLAGIGSATTSTVGGVSGTLYAGLDSAGYGDSGTGQFLRWVRDKGNDISAEFMSGDTPFGRMDMSSYYTRVLTTVGAAAASMYMARGIGVKAGTAATRMGAAARTASRISNITSGTLLAAPSFSDQYEGMRAAGYGKASSFGTALTLGSAVAAMESLSFGYLFDNPVGKKTMVKIGMNMVTETGQEVSQTATENLFAMSTYDNERDFTEGMFEAIVGGLSGAGMGSALNMKGGYEQAKEFFVKNGFSNEEASKNAIKYVNMTVVAGEEYARSMAAESNKMLQAQEVDNTYHKEQTTKAHVISSAAKGTTSQTIDGTYNSVFTITAPFGTYTMPSQDSATRRLALSEAMINTYKKVNEAYELVSKTDDQTQLANTKFMTELRSQMSAEIASTQAAVEPFVAYDAAQLTEQEFVDEYAADMGEDQARELYQKASAPDVQMITQEEAMDLADSFRKQLGVSMEFRDFLMSPDGEEMLGQFEGDANKIILNSGVADGKVEASTVYHELAHAFYKSLPTTFKNDIQAQLRKDYGNLTESELEERLVNGTKSYIDSKGEKHSGGVVERMADLASGMYKAITNDQISKFYEGFTKMQAAKGDTKALEKVIEAKPEGEEKVKYQKKYQSAQDFDEDLAQIPQSFTETGAYTEIAKEMRMAEAPQKVFVENETEPGQTIVGIPSTHPQWIQRSDLRDAKLYKKVLDHIEKGTVPPFRASRQRALYFAVANELVDRQTSVVPKMIENYTAIAEDKNFGMQDMDDHMVGQYLGDMKSTIEMLDGVADTEMVNDMKKTYNKMLKKGESMLKTDTIPQNNMTINEMQEVNELLTNEDRAKLVENLDKLDKMRAMKNSLAAEIRNKPDAVKRMLKTQVQEAKAKAKEGANKKVAKVKDTEAARRQKIKDTSAEKVRNIKAETKELKLSMAAREKSIIAEMKGKATDAKRVEALKNDILLRDMGKRVKSLEKAMKTQQAQLKRDMKADAKRAQDLIKFRARLQQRSMLDFVKEDNMKKLAEVRTRLTGKISENKALSKMKDLSKNVDSAVINGTIDVATAKVLKDVFADFKSAKSKKSLKAIMPNIAELTIKAYDEDFRGEDAAEYIAAVDKMKQLIDKAPADYTKGDYQLAINAARYLIKRGRGTLAEKRAAIADEANARADNIAQVATKPGLIASKIGSLMPSWGMFLSMDGSDMKNISNPDSNLGMARAINEASRDTQIEFAEIKGDMQSEFLATVGKNAADVNMEEEAFLTYVAYLYQGDEKAAENILDQGLFSSTDKVGDITMENALSFMEKFNTLRDETHDITGRKTEVYEESTNKIFNQMDKRLIRRKYEFTPEARLQKVMTTKRMHEDSSFAKERSTKISGTLRTDFFQTVNETLDEDLNYIHMAPVVDSTAAVVNTAKFMQAVGSNGVDFWVNQIDLINRRGIPKQDVQNKGLRVLKDNVSVGILGFKASSMAAQPFALANGIATAMMVEPGMAKYLIKNGLGAFTGSNNLKQYMDESKQLTLREGTLGKPFINEGKLIDANGVAKLERMKANSDGGIVANMEILSQQKEFKWIKETSMIPLQTLDMYTAAAAQKGFEQFYLDQGVDATEARGRAEFLMQVSQGASDFSMMPQFMYKYGDMGKVTTMFLTFAMAQSALMSVLGLEGLGRAVMKGDLPTAVRRGSGALTVVLGTALYQLITGMINDFMKANPPDEDELDYRSMEAFIDSLPNILRQMPSSFFSNIPGVGIAIDSYSYNKAPSSPILTLPLEAIQAFKSAGNTENGYQAALKYAIAGETLMQMFGAPVSQLKDIQRGSFNRDKNRGKLFVEDSASGFNGTYYEAIAKARDVAKEAKQLDGSHEFSYYQRIFLKEAGKRASNDLKGLAKYSKNEDKVEYILDLGKSDSELNALLTEGKKYKLISDEVVSGVRKAKRTK